MASNAKEKPINQIIVIFTSKWLTLNWTVEKTCEILAPIKVNNDGIHVNKYFFLY